MMFELLVSMGKNVVTYNIDTCESFDYVSSYYVFTEVSGSMIDHTGIRRDVNLQKLRTPIDRTILMRMK